MVFLSTSGGSRKLVIFSSSYSYTYDMRRTGNFIYPDLPQYIQLQMSTNNAGKVPAMD